LNITIILMNTKRQTDSNILIMSQHKVAKEKCDSV